ncbi:MAG: alginate O-acetyltransferase AlgX-related protein [Bacteroidia bacterium]
MIPNYKKYLFLALIFFLFLPILQQFTNYFEVFPLNGVVKDAVGDLPPFKLDSWKEGSYQSQVENWANQRFGFREDLVRTYNQVNYDLFRKSNLGDMQVGKEDYLFQGVYYDAYTGKDLVKRELAYSKCKQIKLIQDSLERAGKVFFLMICPSKANFFPEYLPDNIAKTKNIEPNYHQMLEISKELGIKVLDFNAYFLAQKNKSPYPLFPKNGIHWSSYGATLALDSMVHYIESRKGVDLPDIQYEVKMETASGDNDLEWGMNLLYPLPTYPLALPDLKITTENKQKLKTLLISDSFGWFLYRIDEMDKVFEKFEVWQYYQERFLTQTQKSSVNKTNLKSQVLENDVIILSASTINLPRFGWGFLEDMASIYENKAFLPSEIQAIKQAILANPTWLEQVKLQAEKSRISLDSALTDNAIYQLQQK